MIIIFITHSTLGHQHAKMTFMSLAGSKDPIQVDELCIYNSHQHELPNDELLKLYKEYDMSFIKKVTVFDYDEKTSKTLAGDIHAIRTYCNNTYSQNERILLLKSDCLLSINFMNELKKFDDVRYDNFVFTAPLFNAKQSVTDEELLEYIKTPYAILSSDDTFFMEDEVQSKDNDFRNRVGISYGDPCIKYTSCRVKRDWSCHFLPVNVLMKVKLVEQDWGGVSFADLTDMWVGAYKSFVVHKYHSIVSDNRKSERPGDYGEWLAL